MFIKSINVNFLTRQKEVEPAYVEPSRDATWIFLTGEDLAIRFWWKHTHVVEFRVFDASYDPEDPFRITFYDNRSPPAAWESADYELEGGLKWDGCVNWTTSPDCMAHGCGPEMIDTLAAIFTTVYTFGARYFEEIRNRKSATIPTMPPHIEFLAETVEKE